MGDAPGFELFGITHVAALALIVLGATAVSRIGESPWLPRTMAIVLTVLVVLKPILFIGVYDEPWGRSLPLALCRINEFLCIYLLLKQNYRTFEVAYFLTIGSVSALLMPDLSYGIGDPRFVLFFVSHGLSVMAIVYAMAGFGFRPTLGSVGRVLIFLAIYTLIIAGMNVVLDANYLFLMEKPQGASVLDYMGPWPVYVIALIGLAIVLCFLSYLPFAKWRHPTSLDG